MKFFLRNILISFLLLFLVKALYADQNMSLDFQDVNLRDAIKQVAKVMDRNVLISPTVQEVVSIHLKNTSPQQVFATLLSSYHLAQLKLGNIFYIAPHEELIKSKKAEIAWQEMQDNNLTLGTQIIQLQYARADDIFQLFKNDSNQFLSKRGRMIVDSRTNVIIINDVMEKILKIEKIIKRLDVPVKQIAITARLASVDSDFEKELGINFLVNIPTANSAQSVPGMQLPTSYYSLMVAKLADETSLDVKLAALESEGHAELISSPSLFATNQQTASIETGEEIPYQHVTETGGTAVVFKKAVLALKVTPQVLPNNMVLLQLQINQDRPNSQMILGMPTISTRQITTSVLIKNGQTIALGGIYETVAENSQQRLPFISQIPIIGLLFKQQHVRNNKRELLIFITPKIIR